MRKQREVPDKLYLGQLPSMTKLYPVSAQIEKVFFDIYVTEFGADLTTVLPVCSSIVVNTVVVTAGNFVS